MKILLAFGAGFFLGGLGLYFTYKEAEETKRIKIFNKWYKLEEVRDNSNVYDMKGRRK